MTNPSVQIIDVHQHVDGLGMDKDGLSSHLTRLGVSKCWLLSWESFDGLSYDYQHLPIINVFEAWEKYPDQFIPAAGVDCRRDNAEQLLREYHARGARVYGEIKWHVNYDCWDAIRMFRLAGQLGMPVLVHLQYPSSKLPTWWYGGHIASLERAVKLCPDTIFLGHAQSWWAHLSGDADPERFAAHPKGPVTPGGEVVRLLETYPNLYGDLSADSGYNAMTRDPTFGRKFLIDFADKLCYGTDEYTDRHLKYLTSLGLPADVYAKIMGGNAGKLVAT